jgi:hypothetical protein
MKKLYIVIGCDSDPDRPGFLPGVTEEGKSWRGLVEGPEVLKNAARSVTDSTGKTVKVTWVLRVDEQVRLLYGDYAWVLSNYRDRLLQLENDGDELGWHPHFYKYSQSHKKWYQELRDTRFQAEMLGGAYAAFMRELPGRAKSVRTGWIFHNNETMNKLSELGVEVDFSALPGMRTNVRENDPMPYNIFDWYATGHVPYYPSISDYRRPADNGGESLSILEIPNFVSRSFVWAMMGGLHLTKKMRNPRHLIDALSRPTYWINITGKPNLFAPVASALDKHLKNSDRTEFFVSYFHADELLDTGSAMYSLNGMVANLRTLLQICVRRGFAPEFITAKEVPGLLGK